jgi:hypothetical protein
LTHVSALAGIAPKSTAFLLAEKPDAAERWFGPLHSGVGAHLGHGLALGLCLRGGGAALRFFAEACIDGVPCRACATVT